MTKVAVVFAEGFEEIEALSPVDVFRRAGFDCNMLGLESASVTGSHGIQVAMDGVLYVVSCGISAILLRSC